MLQNFFILTFLPDHALPPVCVPCTTLMSFDSSLLFRPPPVRGATYCDERVCSLSVRLCVCPLAFLNKCSAVAEMGDRLATTDMGRKLGGGLCPIFSGEWELSGLSRGLPPYQVSS